MSGDEGITESSGNVFADLGLPDAADQKLKVRLAVAVNDALKERRLTQKEAADLFGCSQPEISALANYKLRGFSIGRLLEFLTALDRDIEIGIRKTQGPGHIDVRELESA
jgi:predicted XRE-type DNA-binding protein